MQQNPGQLIKPLVEIATHAGAAILAIYNTRFSVETKEDASPLTAADKASHQIIVSALAELTPQIPVLSEESAAIGWAERGWVPDWLIRRGIRQLLAQRLTDERVDDPEVEGERLRHLSQPQPRRVGCQVAFERAH